VSKHWVSTVLRARQIQEDVAKQRLAEARQHAHEAYLDVMAHGERIDGLVTTPAEPESALAFVAAASARQAAASTWAAARQARVLADDHVLTRSSAATTAAQQRRSVEKLAENVAADRVRGAAIAQQKDLDEIAGRSGTEDER
jgi:hypothetical protein